jgi:hypothetical protein
VTRWDGPRLELARPPARPGRWDWVCVLIWGADLAFWIILAIIIGTLYQIGVL